MSEHQRPEPIRAAPFDRVFLSLLALAIVLAFSPASSSFYQVLDDPDYVVNNLHVRHGLHWVDIAWAFTTFHATNWHPLTWLSLQLDASFWPGPAHYHWMNILIHALAAGLLYLCLLRAGLERGKSALVTLLFALHPLRVESVAWVAERKDVLGAFFWMLTLWTYLRYAERPSRRRLALVTGAYGLGILAKPVLVTLPVILMLVDYWPLRRGLRWREKLPFFALSLFSAVMTVLAAHETSMAPLDGLPLWIRVFNGALSYERYLRKIIFPHDLFLFYPIWLEVSGWDFLAMVSLGALLYRAWRRRASRPALIVGWSWYLVSLLPVIGFLQVGSQGMADRYTYLPSVGALIALVWDLETGWARLGAWPRKLASALGGVGIVFLVFLTWAQTAQWQHPTTMWEDAMRAYPNNPIVREFLIDSYFMADKPELAERTLAPSSPRFSPRGWRNLAIYHLEHGGFAKTRQHFSRALLDLMIEGMYDVHLEKAGPASRSTTALVLMVREDAQRAAAEMEQAIVEGYVPTSRLDIDFIEEVTRTRPSDGMQLFIRFAERFPVEQRFDLALECLYRARDLAERLAPERVRELASREEGIEKNLGVDPILALSAEGNLGFREMERQRFAEARRRFTLALQFSRLTPTADPRILSSVLGQLGDLSLRDGKIDEAIDKFSESLLKHPDNAISLDGLALALFRKGDDAAAYRYFVRALQSGIVRADSTYFELAKRLRRAGKYDDGRALLSLARAGFDASGRQELSRRAAADLRRTR